MLKNTFVLGLVLSLAMHLSALLVLREWTPPTFSEPETIEITLQEKNPPISPRPMTEEVKRQIVEQSKDRLNDEIDEDAKYLGRHNQRVAKETKAAAHGQLNNTAAGKLETSPRPQKRNGEAKKKTGMKVSHQGIMPTIAQLKPHFDWEAIPNRGNNPTQSEVSRQNDYLKEVDQGIQTMLSTREFIYYSYYARIKDRLQQYWEPKIKEKMQRLFQSGRTVASNGDKITQLIIVLDNRGILQKVKVIGESGVRDLDDAAIEAFRAAAPFPNPPKGIVEADGTIKIRWDFVLEA